MFGTCGNKKKWRENRHSNWKEDSMALCLVLQGNEMKVIKEIIFCWLVLEERGKKMVKIKKSKRKPKGKKEKKEVSETKW